MIASNSMGIDRPRLVCRWAEVVIALGGQELPRTTLAALWESVQPATWPLRATALGGASTAIGVIWSPTD